MKFGGEESVTRDRYLGCVVGLSVGDDLGAPVEIQETRHL